MRRRSAGYSLIELLVVIGIITILIAILMPALARVRRMGRGAVCLSNLRQLGAAYRMYCNSNSNHSVPNTIDAYGLTWWEVLSPYCTPIQPVMLCSEATEPGNMIGSAFKAWGPQSTYKPGQTWQVRSTYTGSYALNGWLVEPLPAERDDESPLWKAGALTPNAKPPDRIPLFGDCIMGWAAPSDADIPPKDRINPMQKAPDDTSTQPPPAFQGAMAYYCLDRHFGAINLVFLDGHAETVGLAQLWQLKWNNSFRPRSVTVP